MIVPADSRYAFPGHYIVFVALPDPEGADGLVTYALGPFDDREEAQLAARAAQKSDPDAFVRWSPLRPPGPGEAPMRRVIEHAPEP
jgi:SPOR domain